MKIGESVQPRNRLGLALRTHWPSKDSEAPEEVDVWDLHSIRGEKNTLPKTVSFANRCIRVTLRTHFSLCLDAVVRLFMNHLQGG